LLLALIGLALSGVLLLLRLFICLLLLRIVGRVDRRCLLRRIVGVVGVVGIAHVVLRCGECRISHRGIVEVAPG